GQHGATAPAPGKRGSQVRGAVAGGSGLQIAPPRPASLDLRTDLFIDGKFVPSETGQRFATVNPATGETLAEVAEAGKADLDRAVAGARKTFESGPWASMKAPHRGPMHTRARTPPPPPAGAVRRRDTQRDGKPFE